MGLGQFVGTIQQLVEGIGPWYMKGPHLQKFVQAMAMQIDESITTLQLGGALGWPLMCERSALPTISRDRTVRLYPSEPESSKRARLAQWLQLHRAQGTHAGDLRHMQPYFQPEQPMIRIVHQAGDGSRAVWHTIDGAGEYSYEIRTPSNWNYDPYPERWWRYWIILYAPATMTGARYDDGHYYSDGTRYGITSSVGALASDIVAMARESKAAHAWLQGIIVATDPASFDPSSTPTELPSGEWTLPSGNWQRPTVGGVRTRLQSAIWIYDAGDIASA